jgi:hypothetical protein
MLKAWGDGFAVNGAKLNVNPSELEVGMIYNRIPETITGGASNWLSTRYGDIWTQAAVAEQWRFLQDYEAADTTEAYWRDVAQRSAAASMTNQSAGGALRMTGR